MKKIIAMLSALLLLALPLVSRAGEGAETTPAATTETPATTTAVTTAEPEPQPPFPLDGKTFVLKAKGGDSGKLFGAITGKEIAALIEKESGVAVDKKKLVVDTIKNFGTYACTVKLYTGIAAKINVSVEKED